MTLAAPRTDSSTDDAALREIEQRVLWLATAVVDHANRVRPNPSGRSARTAPAALALRCPTSPRSARSGTAGRGRSGTRPPRTGGST